MSKRLPLIIGIVIVLAIGVGAWLWLTAGQESTDDAQVEAHVTPVAARVGGTVLAVQAPDNQQVEAGALLVQIDPRDYEIAVARAEAELATAEADFAAARANVPITSATATGNVSNARGGVAQAQAGIAEAEQGLEAARARVVTAQARLREQEANATRAARDVERLRPLIAKQEIPQQQFDAAVSTPQGDQCRNRRIRPGLEKRGRSCPGAASREHPPLEYRGLEHGLESQTMELADSAIEFIPGTVAGRRDDRDAIARAQGSGFRHQRKRAISSATRW